MGDRSNRLETQKSRRRLWVICGVVVILLGVLGVFEWYNLRLRYQWATSLFEEVVEGQGVAIRNERFDAITDVKLRKVLATGPIGAIRARLYEHGDPGKAEVVVEDGLYYHKAYLKQNHWRQELVACALDRMMDWYRVPLAVPRRFTILNSHVTSCVGMDTGQRFCSWEGIGEEPLVTGETIANLYAFVDGLTPKTVQNYRNCFDNNTGLPLHHATFQMGERIEVNIEPFGIRRIFGDLQEVPCSPRMTAEFSDMMVFDHLISQRGRWYSSTFKVKNIFTAPAFGDSFVWVDNGIAFEPDHPKLRQPALSICHFSALTIKALLHFYNPQHETTTFSQHVIAAIKRLYVPFLPPHEIAELAAIARTIDVQFLSLIHHYQDCIEAHGDMSVLFHLPREHTAPEEAP